MRHKYDGHFEHTVTQEMFDGLLLWAVENGASDVVLNPDDPVWTQIHGRWAQATTLRVTEAETSSLICLFTGQSQAAARVHTGNSLDFAYQIRISRNCAQRFRVNATKTSRGIYIVMRALPRNLPLIGELHLEPALEAAFYPDCGLVVASGVMGSGKSTLLAGVLHTAVLTKGRQILTLEEPIEFDFTSIPAENRTAPVGQSNIGMDIPTWNDGVRTMTRRKAEIVLVGEARDRETLANMITAVEQGVTAYSTVHAHDVPQTITRIINAFEEVERPSIAAVLKANLRLCVHQRLVRRADADGRIALREFLVFDEGIRRLLYTTTYGNLIPVVRDLVEKKGQTLVSDARRKYEKGIISEEIYESIKHEQEVSDDNLERF